MLLDWGLGSEAQSRKVKQTMTETMICRLQKSLPCKTHQASACHQLPVVPGPLSCLSMSGTKDHLDPPLLLVVECLVGPRCLAQRQAVGDREGGVQLAGLRLGAGKEAPTDSSARYRAGACTRDEAAAHRAGGVGHLLV